MKSLNIFAANFFQVFQRSKFIGENKKDKSFYVFSKLELFYLICMISQMSKSFQSFSKVKLFFRFFQIVKVKISSKCLKFRKGPKFFKGQNNFQKTFYPLGCYPCALLVWLNLYELACLSRKHLGVWNSQDVFTGGICWLL